MPRRKAAIKREVLPDPLYTSDEVAKFINIVMRRGKKSIAERIVYDSLGLLTDRLKKDTKSGATDKDDEEGGKGGKTLVKGKGRTYTKNEILETLHKSLVNIAPTVEVKSRRVGGATYQVPVEVALDRGIALAMRWVVSAAKARGEKTMSLRLAGELHDAYLGRGAAVKMRDDMHRTAKANQAFAHYRW